MTVDVFVRAGLRDTVCTGAQLTTQPQGRGQGEGACRNLPLVGVLGQSPSLKFLGFGVSGFGAFRVKGSGFVVLGFQGFRILGFRGFGFADQSAAAASLKMMRTGPQPPSNTRDSQSE